MDLDEYLSETESTDPKTMRPEDAAALLRRIRRHKRVIAEKSALAEAEHRKINDWFRNESMPLDEAVINLEHHLENWMRAQQARNPKLKTWECPNGELRLRASRPSVVMTDPSLLAKTLIDSGHEELVNFPAPTPKAGDLKVWAKTLPMSESETEETDPTVAFSHLVLDGEILPGAYIRQAIADKFDYTTG